MGVIFDSMTNEQAVLWYGVTSLINALPPLVDYLAFKSNPYVEAYKVGVAIKSLLWWPVALTWIYSYIDDTKVNRAFLDNSVTLSVLDPWGGSWIALNAALVHIYDTEIEFKWTTWVGLGVWGVLTIWEMIMQVHFLPKIYSWIETAPAMNLLSSDMMLDATI